MSMRSLLGRDVAGYIVIAQADTADGEGLVIAFDETRPEPYAVWRVYPRETGAYSFVLGHYFKTLDLATRDYNRRRQESREPQ